MLYKNRIILLLCMVIVIIQTVSLHAGVRQFSQRLGQGARGYYSASPAWKSAAEEAALAREKAADQLALRRKEAEKMTEQARARADQLAQYARERAAEAEKIALWERKAGITNANRFEPVGATTREQVYNYLGLTRPIQLWQSSAARRALQNGRQKVISNAKQGLQNTKSAVGRTVDRQIDIALEHPFKYYGGLVIGGTGGIELNEYRKKQRRYDAEKQEKQRRYDAEKQEKQRFYNAEKQVYADLAKAGNVDPIEVKIELARFKIHYTIMSQIHLFDISGITKEQADAVSSYLYNDKELMYKTVDQTASDLQKIIPNNQKLVRTIAARLHHALDTIKVDRYDCTLREAFVMHQEALNRLFRKEI